MSIADRRALIDLGHPALSIVRQCALVSISRSSFYYAPALMNEATLALMRTIDAAFLECPGTAAVRWPGTCAASAMLWGAIACGG